MDNLNGHEVYVSTYSDYKDEAYELTNNVLIANKSDVDVPTKAGYPDHHSRAKDPDPPHSGNMYQWWHLDKLMKTYKDKLLNHTHLLKIRTDCNLYDKITLDYFSDIVDGDFCCNSDHSFYATSKHFIATMSDFLEKSKTEYYDKCKQYFPINYFNFINSDFSENKNISKAKRYEPRHIRQSLRIKELIHPTDVFSKDHDTLVQNIKNRTKDGKLNIDHSKGYTISGVEGNKYFGSEKYLALHIINRSVAKQYKLPTFGVY
jgi:hypothetical protein